MKAFKTHCSQNGSVLVMTALALFVIMGMAGLAVDFSHAYTNKTRLQNLADALALSAAISLNKQESSSTIPDKEAYAEDFAKSLTFSDFVESYGNKEVQDGIATADLTFTFATNWSATAGHWLAADKIDEAKFARVTVNSANSWKIATWLAGIIGFDDVAVNASAVAGTVPINPCDNVLPIMMCSETNNPKAPVDSDGARIDTNCNDNNDSSGFTNSNNDCYGYERDVVYATKESKWKANDIGPGNFGYFDVGSGGSDIKECLAGAPDCTANLCELLDDPDPTLTSEPGGKVGPGEQGLNTRFDDYKGSIKYNGIFPLPDSIVKHSLSTIAREPLHEFDPGKNYTATSAQIYNSYYKDHYLTSNDLTSDHKFTPGRRLVVMPFVACPGNTNGKKPLEIVGFGCWFLTSPSDGKTIYQEFLGKEGEGCNFSGTTTSTNDFGFYKVQLYKDPFGGHS
jgi:Flp pilus assembly protein TadG